MNAWSQIQFTLLAAGLGLFLFGVNMLEGSIKSLAGRTFKLFLQKQTGHPVKAVIAGAITTGIMQSSSTVTLLVMSFTGSGILPLKNGIGLILGANLGTTITGWIVALLGFKLNPEGFYLFFIAIGALGLVFMQGSKIQAASRLVFGFGLLFMGLSFMKDSFIPFAEQANVTALIGKPMILFTLFGFILAAALRSSSAAIVIFLTSLSAGSITLLQGAYLAIGADLGTTVTGLLGTINGNGTRKKTGWAQFYINVLTSIITFICIHPLLYSIAAVGIQDPLVALVAFHSAFNLLGIILILPMIGPFTGWIDRRISSKSNNLTTFLSPGNKNDAIACIDALERETRLFLGQSIELREKLYTEPVNGSHSEAYYRLKEYENEIFNYVLPVLQRSLSKTEAEEIQLLFSSIRSATLAVKEIKDIRHNAQEFRQDPRDDLFVLESEITQKVHSFSNQFTHILDTGSQLEALTDLAEENESSYTQNKEKAFALYRIKQDFDLAGLLNMVREVRDSNNLLIKAIEVYGKCIRNSAENNMTE